MGKIFGIYSLVGSALCILISELHISYFSPRVFNMMLFASIQPPWLCVALMMTRMHINVGNDSSAEEKKLFLRRMRELRRRFPVMLLLFILAFIIETGRCFFDSQKMFWQAHIFAAFFLFPAIMLLRVLPRSRDLIAKWNAEDGVE